jgi:hypothetical protein
MESNEGDQMTLKSVAAILAAALSLGFAATANAARTEPYITNAKIVTPGSEETKVTYEVKGVGQERQFLLVFKEGKWVEPSVFNNTAERTFTVKGLTAGVPYVFKLCAPFKEVVYHGCESITDDDTGGEILWKGDGSEELWHQWVLVADQLTGEPATKTTAENTNSSRVKVETTGAPVEASPYYKPTEQAVHFMWKEGDTVNRSEILNRGSSNAFGTGAFFEKRTFKAGNAYWIAFQAWYPKDWPFNNESSSDAGTFQIHPDGTEPYGVPFGISVGRALSPTKEYEHGKGTPHAITKEDEEKGYKASEVGYLKTYFWLTTSEGPHEAETVDRHIYPEKWYNFTIYYVPREKAKEGGEIKFYRDGELLWHRGGPGAEGVKTGDTESISKYNRPQMGVYPDEPKTNPTTDLYIAGFNVSTTRETAENYAFGK